MLNFLYDLTATQPSPESKFHGGGAYGEIVFFKLLEYQSQIHLFAVYNTTLYINPALVQACEKNNIPLLDINTITITDIIKKYNINRCYSALLNLNQGWPLDTTDVYTTVHGLRTCEMPTDAIMLSYATSAKEKVKDLLFMSLLRSWYHKKLLRINKRLLDSRLHIITISDHSKASIQGFYPELQSKDIPVFASPDFDQLKDCPYYTPIQAADLSKLDELHIPAKRFFLITSAARWAKNALRAIQAADSFFSDGWGEDMVCVVTGATHKALFTKHIKNKKHFVILDYVDRDVLALLHQQAYAFIYPSLNEGFGYPPVQAMKYGVPVIASGTSSIPEVCGDAVLYFDPYSISEIKNRLIQTMQKNIYDALVAKGKERYVFVSTKQKQDLDRLAAYLTKQ